MAVVTVSAPMFGLVGEGIQLGPIQLTTTITPVQGSITSLGPASSTIGIPAGASALFLFPPSNNVGTLTIKGLAGDNGFVIPRNSPSVFFFDTTAAGFNVVITTGAAAGLINYVVV